jgi:hypothetical protein
MERPLYLRAQCPWSKLGELGLQSVGCSEAVSVGDKTVKLSSLQSQQPWLMMDSARVAREGMLGPLCCLLSVWIIEFMVVEDLP